MALNARLLGKRIYAVIQEKFTDPRAFWTAIYDQTFDHIRTYMDLVEVVRFDRTELLSYEIPDEDFFLTVLTAPLAGPYTVTLPANPFQGQYVTIRDETGEAATGNPIIIERNGQLIDGSAVNGVIDSAFGGVTYVYTGTQWITVAGGTGGGISGSGIPLIEWFTVADEFDTVHTVSQTPVSNIRVYLNGQLLREGGGFDYTVLGSDITVSHPMVTNDWLTAVYYDASGGGGGGGANVYVNGVQASSDVNFNDLLPAAPAGAVNVKWQRDASPTNNIAAYLDVNSVTDTVLRDSAGLSVIGRAAAVSGDPGDIAALNDHEVLRRSGSTLAFGQVASDGLANEAVTTTKLLDGAVTNAKLTDMAAHTVKVNALAVLSDPQDLAVGTNTVLGRLAGDLIAAQVATAQIADLAVTTSKLTDSSVVNAKLADMTEGTVKGRATGAGTGSPTDLGSAEITALLNLFTSVLQGAVPASGGGSVNFLRADGVWAAPPGTDGGGGGGGGGGRDYLFSLEGSVPAGGQAYLYVGDVATSSTPFIVPTDSDFSGASVRVNVPDPTNTYDIEFLVNGVVQETLTLAATLDSAYADTFTYSAVAGDEISVRLTRTAGAGASTFTEVMVAVDIGGGAGGGGGPIVTTITMVAGEALALGSLVSLDPNGQVYLADATTASGYWRPFGVSTAVYGISGSAEVHATMGALIPVLFGAAPPGSANGDVVYLSETAGEATLIAPGSSGTVVVELGILKGANGVDTTPEILWQPRLIAMIP